MANGDVTKYSKIYDLGLIEFLNILSLIKDKQKLHEQQQREARRVR